MNHPTQTPMVFTVTEPFKLRITHIDAGAYEGVSIEEPNTGKWPKVSFNDGETLSWFRLSNTKIIFAIKGFEDVFTDPYYEELVLEFIKSPHPYRESNWRSQRQRVPTPFPYAVQIEEETTEREIA